MSPAGYYEIRTEVPTTRGRSGGGRGHTHLDLRSSTIMDLSSQQVHVSVDSAPPENRIEQLRFTEESDPIDMSESESLLETNHSGKGINLRTVLTKLARYARANFLLILIVLGVLAGIVVGVAVREAHPSDTAIHLVAFPGDIFLRSLKMLILPLIVFSLIAGLGSLNIRTAGTMGVLTLVYYAVTTTLAVGVGLLLVTTIHPGNSDTLAIGCTNQSHSQTNDLDTLDSFLDLIRYGY